MRITIAAIGRLKEAYWQDSVREYQKRMSRYAKFEIVEFPDEKAPEGISEKEAAEILFKEGERLLHFLEGNDGYVIALQIQGKRMDSESFAEFLRLQFLKGERHVIFLIGGSLGLSEEVLRRADLSLSFSDFTFPHQLMRVILCEQICRAMRIMRGEPYHK